MSIRKRPLKARQLMHWSQMRRRGQQYLVCGCYEDGEVVVVGIFDSFAEACIANSGWLQARQRDIQPARRNPRLIYQHQQDSKEA